MTSGRPGPSGESEGARRLSPGFDNQATDVQGNVVQAGSIDGGVHIHNYYAEPPPAASPSHYPPPAAPPPMMPPPAMPLSAASPMSPPFGMPAAIPFALRAARPRRQWPGKVARWFGGWLVSLAPIFLLSIVPAGVGFAIAGDDSIWTRLIGFGIGLAVVGVIGLVWWLVSRRSSRLSLRMFVLWALDRLAFKRLGTASVPALCFIIVLFAGAMIAGLGQQPQPSTNGGPSGAPSALVFCALVVLVAARRLKRGS
jgi:hypothetical protein